jgi:8-oxo-dGTP pyrophosphatase MutT (NUDIX family)
VTRIHLATGLLVRGERTERRVLLVASRYAGRAEPLWNLPGGRQQPGELLIETVAREVFEETGLRVRVSGLAYVSESYDGDRHFLNATFLVEPDADSPLDIRVPEAGDHVDAAEWVPLADIASRIAVAVVRGPLLAYLSNELAQRYAGFHEAGVTIQWPNDSP